jgi:crotonobetainyl-CoA:carnitine CoA-transferase CaiB-like acyl-CoA transferase
LKEVFADPQIAARAMVAQLQHAKAGALTVLGTPLKLSDTAGAIRTPPPLLGEHTDAVLRQELGFTREQVAALRSKGIV